MNHPYCLPLIKPDKKEILATIRRHNDDYAYFEVWLDYVAGLDIAFVDELKAESAGRLVVVFRRQQLEPIRLDQQRRYEILHSLDGSAVLVDLDVDSQQAEIDYIEKIGLRLQTVISYHNYRSTPNNRDLQNILQRIRKNNPSILKIATKCQNEDDALRLLEILLSLRRDGQKYIVLGMGGHGLVTRIFGSLWGNELIFAPERPDERSAPGQLTRKQLDKILHTIGE